MRGTRSKLMDHAAATMRTSGVRLHRLPRRMRNYKHIRLEVRIQTIAGPQLQVLRDQVLRTQRGRVEPMEPDPCIQNYSLRAVCQIVTKRKVSHGVSPARAGGPETRAASKGFAFSSRTKSRISSVLALSRIKRPIRQA